MVAYSFWQRYRNTSDPCAMALWVVLLSEVHVHLITLMLMTIWECHARWHIHIAMKALHNGISATKKTMMPSRKHSDRATHEPGFGRLCPGSCETRDPRDAFRMLCCNNKHANTQAAGLGTLLASQAPVDAPAMMTLQRSGNRL